MSEKKRVHSAQRISGPRHNWLGLEFSEREISAAPRIERLAPRGECRHAPLSEDALLRFVLAGVAEANRTRGTDFHVSRIKYVANDTPPENVYARLAYKIVSELVEN